MHPDVSEFSYGYVLTESLVAAAGHGIKAAPVFPSLIEDGKNLNSWQAVCEALRIKVAGDSARRKLRNWARLNKPNLPEVPTLDGDT